MQIGRNPSRTIFGYPFEDLHSSRIVGGGSGGLAR